MDTSAPSLQTLFDQLGLPSGEDAIWTFIDQHSPLNPQVSLIDADFWSSSQREFLREAIEDDSIWAEPVDELDALLRAN